MKLGDMLFEAKLTESDFQSCDAAVLRGYRDFEEVFDAKDLPREGKKQVSYQLIRNVLAAHASDCGFCVLLDARRPDLVESWYADSALRPPGGSASALQGADLAGVERGVAGAVAGVPRSQVRDRGARAVRRPTVFNGNDLEEEE